MNKQINRAAYMTAVRTMEIKEIPMPQPEADEVIVRVEYVGICGSDAHFFQSGMRKGAYFDLPFILGHECAGTICEAGSNVDVARVGERICFEPQITCGTCSCCKSGHYNMCPNVHFPSVPPYDGMLRNYVAIPAHLAFRLPDNVSTKEGALIEPLAVGLSAAARGEVSLGKTVVILGGGCIGLVTMLACKAMGASKVIVTDLFQNRLIKASSLGADEVICAKDENVVDRVMELTNGMGADVVFETAGSSITAAQTPALLKSCGIVVLVGNINNETPYRFMDLMYKEGEIRTIYRYRNNFQTALQAVAQGAIPISEIVSHEFTFDDVQTGFEYALEHQQEIIKGIIKL